MSRFVEKLGGFSNKIQRKIISKSVNVKPVMNMKHNWKAALICAVIAFVLPLSLLLVQKPFVMNNDPTTKEPEKEPSVGKDYDITVLNENGESEQMEMNEYLTCVVLCEMPASFEPEALKAQAVVARTYALRRQKSGSKHSNADICMDSSCCQGYVSISEYLESGGQADAVEKVKNAVSETAGEVLLYDGELIEATYFSCSGGFTEDASAVWGSDIPYLQSTKSPGEEKATYFTDTVQYSTKEFADRLGRSLSETPATWIENITYTAGGGIDRMRICGVDYPGTELRKLLGLRSTSFLLSVVGDTITITTKGYGHRVGMSQYGADAMAVQGSTYDQILTHYYQGVELSRLDTTNN